MTLKINSVLPLVKSNTRSVSDKGNYRPVTLSSVISKVLEKVMYHRITHYLDTLPNQFGFKPGLHVGTDTCIFKLKQVIDCYHSLSSSVYVAFMGASKAFNKINHDHLKSKLLQRKVPIILVRLLYF